MKIVLSDANIFIDLCNIGLLDEFFSLNFEFHTTEQVMNEIKRPEQKQQIEKYINKSLNIKILTGIDVLEVAQLLNSNVSNLSYVDCEVWYLSKQQNLTLLTGDKNLRLQATKDNIEVRGILFLFDEMIEQNCITQKYAYDKLFLLSKTNIRLPKKEIEKRLINWNS
ncbi:hypothetical protein BZG01_11355 [Labilibaculum manganireducens]|uniref:PIN domain-containing protein n=1 Tax=Labilibaculum manganireducens TaxID=1940525 RepID=A0A2N3I7T5_9BACT|nr:hypothetical protein [Labilibaculum manganireducens]PKQ66394.1 hypothetical protein BZG01_11355 [Labilibaculum manganireducens]